MVKKSSKKLPKKKLAQKARLTPGKKLCKQCSIILPIHTKICTECGHIHEMKKKKTDIMKNLNKITPILIKSIIENNDFNQFRGWGSENQKYSVGELMREYKEEEIAMARKKSSTKKTVPPIINPTIVFEPTNHKNFKLLCSKYPITCLSSSLNNLIYVQSIHKSTKQLKQSEILTIKAYGLENYHCRGLNYQGQSAIKILKNDQLHTQIKIHKHIINIKCFANLIAALTGQGTIIIFSYQQQKQQNLFEIKTRRKSKQKTTENLMNKQPQHQTTYTLKNKLQIFQVFPDRITSYQWLRASATQQQIYIVIGTYFGHISIFKIFLAQTQQYQQDYILYRYINKSHYQSITCIQQCPLNINGERLLFATGCYDGEIKIWDVYQQHRIIEFNTTNKPINRIYWDPGAKFMLIARDQIHDTLVLVCFFSINKIEETVHLANTVEMRTIKKSFPAPDHLIPHSNINISQQSFISKHIGLLDCVNGFFRVLSLEQIRSTSLKKKKTKDGSTIENMFHILLKPQNIDIRQIQQNSILPNMQDENQKKIKKFPIFSDNIIIPKSEKSEKQKKSKNKYEYEYDFYIASYEGKIIKYQCKSMKVG